MILLSLRGYCGEIYISETYGYFRSIFLPQTTLIDLLMCLNFQNDWLRIVPLKKYFHINYIKSWESFCMCI